MTDKPADILSNFSFVDHGSAYHGKWINNRKPNNRTSSINSHPAKTLRRNRRVYDGLSDRGRTLDMQFGPSSQFTRTATFGIFLMCLLGYFWVFIETGQNFIWAQYLKIKQAFLKL